MPARKKEIWTSGCDEALNFPYERFILKGEEFLQQWAEYFGEDYETEKHDRTNRTNDRMTLGIIDKVYPMNYLDNFDFVESLKRLVMSGQIKKTKKGWRIKK